MSATVRRRRSRLALLFLCLAAGSHPLGLRAGNQDDSASFNKMDFAEGTLLLVRDWNPRSGELVGWMPMHSAMIKLQILTPPPPKLEVNEAVKLFLPRERRGTRDGGEIQIAPDAVVFDGRRWLPVERETNIARIRKSLFYVKTVTFGDSTRRPRSTSAAEKQAPEIPPEFTNPNGDDSPFGLSGQPRVRVRIRPTPP